MCAALLNQVAISNLYEVRIPQLRILAVQAIVENPRNIVAMNDPENQSLLWRQILGHGGDSDINAPISYGKLVAEQRWDRYRTNSELMQVLTGMRAELRPRTVGDRPSSVREARSSMANHDNLRSLHQTRSSEGTQRDRRLTIQRSRATNLHSSSAFADFSEGTAFPAPSRRVEVRMKGGSSTYTRLMLKRRGKAIKRENILWRSFSRLMAFLVRSSIFSSQDGP